MRHIIRLLIVFLSLVVLTACGSKIYKIDVDLTPGEIEAIQHDIEQLKAKIAEFNADESEYTFPKDEIIELARAYEDLGEIGMAINLYKGVLADGIRSTVAVHNLGRLYEKLGEYEKAITYYQKIMDAFDADEYTVDIIRMHIKLGNKEIAKTMYQKYAVKTGFRDDELLDRIQAME